MSVAKTFLLADVVVTELKEIEAGAKPNPVAPGAAGFGGGL